MRVLGVELRQLVPPGEALQAHDAPVLAASNMI